MTVDKIVGWHHLLSARAFDHTPGDGGGQACCDSLWGCKEPDRTEQLNNDRDC